MPSSIDINHSTANLLQLMCKSFAREYSKCRTQIMTNSAKEGSCTKICWPNENHSNNKFA